MKKEQHMPETENPKRWLTRHLMAVQHEPLGQITVQLWEQLAKSLMPIIGKDGFRTLYDRSVHLAGEKYDWLSNAQLLLARADAPFDVLQEILQGRTHQEASEAGILLLNTFIDILALLIGDHLTTNLLCAAWGSAFETAQKEIQSCATK